MTKIKVGYGFLFLCCAVLVFCGFDTALCTLIAVLVHEISHVAAALFFGGKLSEITLGFFGISMKVSFEGLTSYHCDMICALAGPASNIILGIAAGAAAKESFGYIFAGTNLLFGLYNLIPAAGLDGGTVTEALFKQLFPICPAERLLFVFNVLFSVLVFALGVFVFFRSYNVTLMLFGLILGLKALNTETGQRLPVENKASP